ncbi:MAG: SAP domain-containing protein [Thiohalomonadales bacterium]
MQLQDVKTIAKDIGIKPGKLSKLNLIHEIQRTEGNFDCFATATEAECDQSDCCWRNDCFALAQKAAPTLVSVN